MHRPNLVFCFASPLPPPLPLGNHTRTPSRREWGGRGHGAWSIPARLSLSLPLPPRVFFQASPAPCGEQAGGCEEPLLLFAPLLLLALLPRRRSSGGGLQPSRLLAGGEAAEPNFAPPRTKLRRCGDGRAEPISPLGAASEEAAGGKEAEGTGFMVLEARLAARNGPPPCLAAPLW